MSNKKKSSKNSENRIKPAAVVFGYVTRIFALGVFVACIVITLLLVIGDTLTRNLLGYAFFAIKTSKNEYVDTVNIFPDYEIFTILFKVIFPMALIFFIALLYVLPVFISKSRGYRIFTGVVVLLISIITITLSVLLVELKKFFPHSENGGQTTDIFYHEIYDKLNYQSFLIISTLTLSSLFFTSAILIFIEAAFMKKGWINKKALVFNTSDSKPLIIKFLYGEVTLNQNLEKKTKNKTKLIESEADKD
ncbi:hypothetical protein [Spiroplasma endosymbiont of Panorpa germanica]|uniref:hypothetical protein n=1 Tax=Spiroplasma endosymbiont of Panorpa germanica TaxID=3066314 RepID=UPI0030D57CF1